MTSAPFAASDSRTLLLDANTDQSGWLMEQLNRAGFRTDFAVSWSAARAALGANYYHSCVVIADLDQAVQLERLDELRRAVPRVWIIVLNDPPSAAAPTLMPRQGIDAVLSAPCSVQDLTCRLAEFSLRARPSS
jgi:DNA-binding response OmpR family regulator